MSTHALSPRSVRRGPARARTWCAVVTALFCLLAALAGCSSPSAPGSYAAPDAPQEAAGGAAGDVASGAAGSSAERQVARTASVSVATSDAEAAAQRVREIAAAHDGWLTYEHLSAREDGARPGQANMTVSVPSDQLDAALTDLAGVGTLLSRSIQAMDVTDAVVDNDARIRSLEASIERISALMERTGSIAEIATVEKELASRQSDLESLRAQRQYYASIVERATIEVALMAPATASANPFVAGLLSGWDALGASVRAVLVLLGALLPFAVVGAAIAAPILWWVRRRRARSAQASDPQAPSPDAEPQA